MPLVETSIHNHVATVTLTHTEKRNALSKALIEAILSAFDLFRSEAARAVVIRVPTGSKVWSAGHDINELPTSGRDPLAYSDPLEQLVRTIRQFPSPVIAMLEGSVWGGACEVCVACDILIGTHTVTFAATPAKIGVPYNTTGLLNFLNALGPRVLKEMLFTAEAITADRAFELGILNHLVPIHQLEETTYRMANRIAENSPLSISAMKEQLRILQNASPLSPETFERLQGIRRSVYDSKDYEEGIKAFLEKRKPVFTGE
jgi:methylmalonyl-CoA decarboxylase